MDGITINCRMFATGATEAYIRPENLTVTITKGAIRIEADNDETYWMDIILDAKAIVALASSFN